MESETFPDVTLADSAINEQRALNPPKQDENHAGKDTFVTLKSKRKRYFLTRNQIILVSCIVIVIFIISIIITAFVTKNICKSSSSSCADCTTEQHSETGSLISHPSNPKDIQSENVLTISGISPQPEINNDASSEYPWSGIRLPRSVIPSLYEISLKIDLVKCIYIGAVNITVKINTTTKYIVFHRSNIQIDETLISLTSRYSPNRIIVRQLMVIDRDFHVLQTDKEMEAGNTYTLIIGHYSGILKRHLKGLYLSSYTTQSGETRNLSASQLQSMDARRAFPCFDEPAMKARFKLSVTYQTGFHTIANMPPISTTRLDNQWMRTDFETTPVMSTYLLAVVVSDFKSRNYTFDSGYELRMWARAEAYSQTEHALQVAIKCFNYFTDYFAMPDVVPKSDHVAVPDFASGAMENWGLAIYRETALLYDRHVSSSHNKFMVTLIVAHEISHTWFGNMVTMKWWDDLWLNEGFASLLMYIAMDNVYPQWNVFAIIVVDDILPVMVEDALTTSHPVTSKIADPEDIPQTFDSISYSKAMAVLRMMRGFAGDVKFRNGLRQYIQKYRFKNADHTELWQTFTEAFNHTYDVGMIMDTWMRQMGYPMVTVEDKGGHFLLHQKRFLLDQNVDDGQKEIDNPFGYKWYVPFTYVTQQAPTDQKIVWLNLGSASIPKPSDGWLLGNYEFIGFFRVMYDKNMWGLLAEQLMKDHTVIPEANRAALIGDAFAFARANLLDYDVALNLTRYLKKEQSYVPWQAFLHSIEFLRGMIANKAAYVQLQHYLRELVAPVFDKVGASDRGQLPERYLRRIILTMACDVGVEKAVNYAKSMFANWMKHDNRLPPDLSMLIYSVGVREGGVLEWDYVWNKTKTTSVATEQEMMWEALVHTQKPWLLWRYTNFFFDPDKIKGQNVRFIIGYFTKTPLARMVVLQFVMSRWDEIVSTNPCSELKSSHQEESSSAGATLFRMRTLQLCTWEDQTLLELALKGFSHDSFVLRDVISDVTKLVNSEFHLNQLEELFKKNCPKEANQAVDNALALMRANIGWMKVNYDRITEWLEKNKP